jgi:serine/threonine protein kinase
MCEGLRIMNEASIFAAALEKASVEQRAAYLAEVCAGDDKLRRRMEALLRAHAEADDLLDLPRGNEATAVYRPLCECPGTVIDPYQLLRQIGEGGFGVVFLAEQTQPIRRTVAIKIIKPGMDTAQVIARFESERQALALMDHPNIARVLDAGATESGRPYFVMELVKGVPITEFCDQNQLLPEARLRLFLTVCQAIQHAHHKGIIHRDIKPSNVLITLHDGLPVVKVIDFGVAKATGQKLTEKTLFTAFGQMVGTPAYMSPEQAEMSGLDIDTRSDVYSLGVLLYELLTGTTPIEGQRLRQAGYAEMQRLIREEEAPRPSTRLSALGGSATVLAGQRGLDVRHLVQLLAADLDWTVMKALDKDRNRRYGTPASFAEDVERYLRREPIVARPPSPFYRLRKFAQRNRTAVIAPAVVAASLMLGIVLTSWQAVRALAAETQASQAQAQAETDRDRALAAERRASESLQQVIREQKISEAAKAEAHAERGKAQERMKWALAMEYLYGAMQSEFQGSYEMAEHLYRQGLDYARTELGSASNQTFYATFALADFYSRRNTTEKGEKPLRELCDLYKRRQEGKPQEFNEAYARALDALGLNLLRQQKWAEAEAVLREDVTIREKIKDADATVVAANARSMLGGSLIGQKKYRDAEPLLLQGYQGLKQTTNVAVFGWAARDMFMPLVKQAVERLVQLYEGWGRPDEAARWRRELQGIKK